MNYSIKIGDLEGLLPPGVFLHSKYSHRLYQQVIGLQSTKNYKARRIFKDIQNKKLVETRKNMALISGTALAKTKQAKAAKKEIVRPQAVGSAKVMTKEAQSIIKEA